MITCNIALGGHMSLAADRRLIQILLLENTWWWPRSMLDYELTCGRNTSTSPRSTSPSQFGMLLTPPALVSGVYIVVVTGGSGGW
jgi:hypothetical protein